MVKELQGARLLYVGNNDNNSLNGNNDLDNNARFVGIALTLLRLIVMHSYSNLWNEICSYENLELAYKRARKHKTKKIYVIEFELMFPNQVSSIEVNRILKNLVI